ncbi:MAG: DUF2892 domain-containing protein [Candidatus Sulfotelmatobacter sp.]
MNLALGKRHQNGAFFIIRNIDRERLRHYASPYWYLFTAFVGLNLFQSGFTNWCPMKTFLGKLGVGRQGE